MDNQTFFSQYQQPLTDYAGMSQAVGKRSDYVQGGGGNTSCKLDDQLMVIKASGFRLDQISRNQAYAILDYQTLRHFFHNPPQKSGDELESAGTDLTRQAVQSITGIQPLRPSVEAGFHALLDRYVLHTHAVYANLATCCEEGKIVAARALADLAHSHIFVPYINPGIQLSFLIDRLRREAARHGPAPAIIFLENHGLIITGEEAEFCRELHDKVNERLAEAFQVSTANWPDISLKPHQLYDQDGWLSQTPWLRRRLQMGNWSPEMLVRDALYPDQLVFLADRLVFEPFRSIADQQVRSFPENAKAIIFQASGEVFYTCSQSEARTIEETICAVLFIRDTITRAGLALRTMNEAGKDFILNWESEAYRKKIAAKEQEDDHE